MQLTSRKNPTIQRLRRAVGEGRPTEDGLFVVEGPHLLEEARRSSWALAAIFGTREALDSHVGLVSSEDSEVTELSPAALASISDTETNQGIVAVVRPRNYVWQEVIRHRSLMLVLDGIQDPGNAGTLLRSAEAFGASGVVFLSGTVRVTNGKLLRASAGSIFRVPFLENVSRQDLLNKLRSAPISLFSLVGNGRVDLRRSDLTQGCAIVVGSEGGGISPELLAGSETLRIPVTAVESLNAAVAGSIALFEAARQRSET